MKAKKKSQKPFIIKCFCFCVTLIKMSPQAGFQNKYFSVISPSLENFELSFLPRNIQNVAAFTKA